MALNEGLGLARVRWVAPRPCFADPRRELSEETLHALFTNRMHVLRAYARHVVLPVCRELARREPAGTLPPGTPKLLIRHPALLAEEARRRLGELLDEYEVLRRVIDYREALQQLWNEAAANRERALAQLREQTVMLRRDDDLVLATASELRFGGRSVNARRNRSPSDIATISGSTSLAIETIGCPSATTWPTSNLTLVTTPSCDARRVV